MEESEERLSAQLAQVKQLAHSTKERLIEMQLDEEKAKEKRSLTPAEELDEASLRLYEPLHIAPQPCRIPGQTFSEYMRHTMVSEEAYSYAPIVDKSAAKAYAKRIVPTLKTAKTLMVFREWNIDDIDTFDFPDSYAFKGVHGSGMNLIVKNGMVVGGKKRHRGLKATRELLKETMMEWVKKCYRCDKVFPPPENQYKKVFPGVILEEFMDFSQSERLQTDYRFYTVSGTPVSILVDRVIDGAYTRRQYHLSWYPHDRKKPGEMGCLVKHKCGEYFEKPPNYIDMVMAVIKLAAPFHQVRVDLYSDGTSVYFGELTFSSHAGLEYIDGFLVAKHVGGIPECDTHSGTADEAELDHNKIDAKKER